MATIKRTGEEWAVPEPEPIMVPAPAEPDRREAPIETPSEPEKVPS